MELFRTEDYYILLNCESSLWCSRKTGHIEVRPGWELANCGDVECVGIFYGLVGKIDFQSPCESRLILIKEANVVGQLPDTRTVMNIRSIIFLHPCGPDISLTEFGLKRCRKHKVGAGGHRMFETPQKAALAKTWGTIKSATNTIKSTTQQAAALATYQVKGGGLRKDSKERERFEKRILDELQRVFTETDSFYFCCGPPGSPICDLTNTLQRQSVGGNVTDDRFFWNKHMLKDILELNIFFQNPLAKAWVLPIIQGFVQIEHFQLELDPASPQNGKKESFTISLISRRSRYRAGTRYKRRGLDENGKCANYVETEQCVAMREHQVSFVQVRGSVPLYWSQPGYKYRPPPHIDKGEAETKVAFEKHMCEEVSIYGPLCIVNLVEQSGKEKVIWEGFTQQVMQYNSELVTYATFDFHEHCRGMRFENVAILVSRLDDVIQDMGFFWKDKHGVICKQNGVFRVNCIDCLDRTNVVQTALGKAILEVQMSKLGLLPPEGIMPNSLRTTFQLLWANNGDIISRQYAGTNALKGDYTRTGERKITGMMKDGMNSANRYLRRLLLDELRQACLEICQGQKVTPPSIATLVAHDTFNLLSTQANSLPLPLENEVKLAVATFNLSRYYLSRFKDVYRQATIDIMQGHMVSDDILNADDEADSTATAEHIKLLIEDCKKLLIADSSLVLGAWGLINADPVSGNPSETDMDTILILTRDAYYIADYDDEIDKMTKYQCVPLRDITKVELGPMEGKAKQTSYYCLRFQYKICDKSCYSHTFRSTNLRFFNNVAVVIKTEEEKNESLRAICDSVRVALEVSVDVKVEWNIDRTLDRIDNSHFNFLSISPHLTRNVSETQLGNIKNVGSKALSNMTSKFTKIGNTISATRKLSFNKSSGKDTTFTVGDQSSEEDEDVVCLTGSRDSQKSSDTFLPNVGIVMSNAFIKPEEIDTSDIEISTETPEIRVETSREERKVPKTLQIRTFSHSSGEVDLNDKSHLEVQSESLGKSNSEKDLIIGITASQSENALKSIKSGFSTASNVLTSPSAVLSPLTKLAKGVQSLGANLDPRKLKTKMQTSIQASAETKRIQEMWSNSGCKSKLVAI
ncbi:hypothetical protein AAG570_009378 [Ranatra chinensis]|uniref:Phosphatidylinositide phosphatase SAC2 n=1 Tax=Ranatra chinensis TaxID=642074 RepID=A0ABD0YZT3_9HEMI